MLRVPAGCRVEDENTWKWNPLNAIAQWYFRYGKQSKGNVGIDVADKGNCTNLTQHDLV
ncbi:hypothetical protein BGY98DRAFT_950555, partial [Russula aff. rugulosa BPL654]